MENVSTSRGEKGEKSDKASPFWQLLEGGQGRSKPSRGDKEPTPGDNPESMAAFLHGQASAWLRPEGGTRPGPEGLSLRGISGVPQPPPTSAADRLLIGFGPQGAEARVSIGEGPLAGAQIHLRHGPGGVEAALLTSTESSRQTLSTAMNEVARRLERKGYRFQTKDDPDPPRRPPEFPEPWRQGNR